MDIKDIEQILKVLKQSDIVDFELEQGGTRIRLSRGAPVPTAVVGQSLSAIAVAAGGYSESSSLVAAAEPDSSQVKVISPMVGTFYRKPSPDAEPFAREGDRVTKGQTLCIIEAMKLMNEIEAPISGVLSKILVGDSQVAEFGEILMLITPEG
jgi:acetyl-CoA carboxylase biotin carboxyl carrier protein